MSNLSRLKRYRSNPNSHLNSHTPSTLTISNPLGFWECFTIAFAIPLLTLIAYVSSLRGEFVFDDFGAAVYNGLVTHAHTWMDVLRILPTPRGLLTATYALNYMYSGPLDTFGWHFTNLVIHATNAVLVFFIIRKLSNYRTFPSIVGSLLFTVHPMLTSAVSSISGRSSLLCATFYFASILAFLYSRWFMVVVLGVLAFYSKQDAIILPVLFIAMILCRPPRTTLGRMAAFIPYVFLLLSAVVFGKPLNQLYAGAVANSDLAHIGINTVLPQPQYLYTYLHGIVTYLLPRMLLPLNLSVDPTLSMYSTTTAVCAIVLFLGLCVLAFELRYNVLASTGLLILMFSPLLVYALIPIADPILEHRAYIPMFGIILLLVSVLDTLNSDWKTKPLSDMAVMLLIAFCLVGTMTRDRVYATRQEFWESAVLSSPDKLRPHLNLAEVYQSQHKFGLATLEYNRAIRIEPKSYAAYSNLASLQIDTDDFVHAESNLHHVLQLEPKSTEAYINLGVMYFRRGHDEIAMQMLDKALMIDPNNEFARGNRNIVLDKISHDNQPHSGLMGHSKVTVIDGIQASTKNSFK